MKGQAFRPGATSGQADQPHGVVSREGQEATERCSPPTASDRHRGERSSSRTPPCRCSCSRFCAPTTPISRQHTNNNPHQHQPQHHTTHRNGLAKIGWPNGLAKNGMAQIGLAKVGLNRSAKKDLSDAEMDTLTKSCSPTILITANGEVQTHEEATGYVKEFDIFLTLKVLENTPAVLSLGKLCDENGYSYEWINGQKPHLIENGIRILCNTENFVPSVVPGLSNSSSGTDSSTSRTPLRQGRHCSSSSSTSSSSPAASKIQTREREDRIDISPVQVSNSVDRVRPRLGPAFVTELGPTESGPVLSFKG